MLLLNRIIRNRTTSVVTTLVLLGGVLTACSSTSSKSSALTKPGKASCPINVLFLGPMTGGYSSYGVSAAAAAQVGIDHVNSAGGVLGCQLKLNIADDDSNFAGELPLLVKATTTRHYSLVMSPDAGQATDAAYLNSQKLLQISSGNAPKSVEPEAPYPTSFETSPLAQVPDIAAVQYELSLGRKRLALILDSGATGSQTEAAVAPYITQAGGKITDTEYVNDAAVDFTAAILRAEASKPQAVLLDVYGPAAGHLRVDIHDAGWKVPIIGGQNDTNTPLQGLIPESYLTGDLGVSLAPTAFPSTPPAQSFVDQLQAAKVTITGSLATYASQYDSIILFAWAAEQTHSLDSTTIATKLHDSGQVAIPGLVSTVTTGYTPTSGEWGGRLAILKDGFFNLGRLPLVKYVNPPTLRKGE
jgi:branched-chain amino acid transport system substrate-binding protein